MGKVAEEIRARHKMTKQELADHLKVDVSTIDRWRKKGMPWQRHGFKAVVFDLHAVEAWLGNVVSSYDEQPDVND